MTDKQPEALSIAKRLKNQQQPLSLALREKAAAELRRLHEVNAELVEALKFYANEKRYTSHLVNDGDCYFDDMGRDILFDLGNTAQAALRKATGENNDRI